MKQDKPILMNTEMVKAILDGRKTETRRIIKTQPVMNDNGYRILGIDKIGDDGYITDAKKNKIKCPYGKVGQKLWVRETWRTDENDFKFYKTLDEQLTRKPKVLYYADDIPKYRDQEKWNPSIHMRREDSRIT